MEKAIEGAALGILYGQGQVCNAGSRLFVHNSIYQQTVDALISLFKKVRVGDPIDRETRMGTLISQKQLDTVLKYVNIGIEEGAELAYGGKRLSGGPYDKGYFMEPTLFTNVSNDMRIAREEIFGPVLCVIPFETEDEVIQMANDSEYGLAGACWTMNLNRALRVAAKIDTGLFWINDFNLTPAGTPFGGFKKSGYGRENHKTTLDTYSQVKTIYISLSESAMQYYDE